MTDFKHNITLTILNTSHYFDSLSDVIQTVTQKTIGLARTKLAISDVDIVFMSNPVEAVPHLGFGGYTPDAHTILISVDTQHKKLAHTLDTELHHTLLHEFHHAIRWRSVGYGETLGEALVTEGLADHFDVEMTGDLPQRWAEALSAEEIERMLERARPLLSKPYSHHAWFFGSDVERLPKWGGYALGYFLVGKYLAAHPDAHASMLHRTPARDILN